MLAAGHFSVDMYAGTLPVLYPALIGRFDLDLTTVGLVSLAFGSASSLSQPFFGWLADRFGTRFTGLTLAWSGVMFSLIAFAPSFPVLIAVATLAGLGSGAFHPFGAVNANAVIPDGHKNTAMSLYVSGGTVGLAAGPLIGAALHALFGLNGIGLMVLPGLSIGIWLLLSMRSAAFGGARPIERSDGASRTPVPWRPLSIIIAVMMLRAFPVVGIQTFVPVWYEQLGYGPGFYGPLATIVVLGGAAGTIGAGSLADRHGRRAVILGSLVLSLPAIWAFAAFPGPYGFLTGAVVGFLGASTMPLLLVMAQSLIKGQAGVASGMILGLGFVAGAIAAPILGAVADAWGMQRAIESLLIVVAVCIITARSLPSESAIAEIVERQQATSPPVATAPARADANDRGVRT